LVEHVQKIGVAARIELIGAVNLDSPVDEKLGQSSVQDGGPHWALTSSPDDGNLPFGKPPPHSGSEAIKTGMQLIMLTPVFRQQVRKNALLPPILPEGSSIRFLPRSPAEFFHIARFFIGRQKGLVFRIFPHMGGNPIQDMAHLHRRSGIGYLKTDDLGAIRLGKDRFT